MSIFLAFESAGREACMDSLSIKLVIIPDVEARLLI